MRTDYEKGGVTMHSITIESRELGTKITISAVGRHFYLDINGQPGELGMQICEKGSVAHGAALAMPGLKEDWTQEAFERIARRWYADFIFKDADGWSVAGFYRKGFSSR